MDPTDGRAYVTLGKLLLQQKRFEEARKLYDDGAAATGTIMLSKPAMYIICSGAVRIATLSATTLCDIKHLIEHQQPCALQSYSLVHLVGRWPKRVYLAGMGISGGKAK